MARESYVYTIVDKKGRFIVKDSQVPIFWHRSKAKQIADVFNATVKRTTLSKLLSLFN